jgi:putative cardiolipin synthase
LPDAPFRTVAARALPGLALLLTLSACVHADKGYPAPASTSWDPETTGLGHRAAEELATRGDDTAFYVLGSGVEAFATRFLMIQRAEKAVDLQYYIWHDDTTGNLLLSEMLKAADRGVRVRLLLDDLGSPGLDDILAAADVHPNFEVRIFNAMARGPMPGLARLLDLVSRPRRLNHRMHNKMLATDGATAVIGGRNIGDEYFGASEYVNFADLDVFVFGPVMKDLGESFDLYWSSEYTSPIAAWERLRAGQADLDALHLRLTAMELAAKDSVYAERVRNSALVKKVLSGGVEYAYAPAIVVADRPEKIAAKKKDAQTHLAAQLTPILDAISTELEIISPYFVPGRTFTDWLTSRAESGVKVSVLTNSLAATDVGAVHAGYAKYRKDLIAGGVKIYELMRSGDIVKTARRQGLFGSSSASLHAKSISFDRSAIFIGSMNLDPRSVDLNTELGVVIFSPELGADFLYAFEQLVSPEFSWHVTLDEDGKMLWTGVVDGEEVVVRKEPDTSWWDRFSVGMLKLLPIEGQL